MDDIKPMLTRQNGFYDELTSDRYKKSRTKYRWIWMMRNEDHLLWRVCTRSQNWFYTYPECKQNAYQYEPIIPPCTYARLYIEIFNNGFKNVVEISSKNDPEEEAYFASDEAEEDKADTIKYRWEWKICTPVDNIWHPYIKCDQWFNDFDMCKRDGKDFKFDVQCCAAIKLCIELWQNDECILETYFDEEELYGNK